MAQHSEQDGSRGSKDNADRILRLEQDVERLLREGGPTDEELAAAPVLSRWTLIIHPNDGLAALVGNVTGHPEVRSGWVVTSPVVVIALEAGWARTVSRMYALGHPGRRDPVMTRRGDRDDGFVRLGDAAMRIAEVVRAKRRRSSGCIVHLEVPPPDRRRATLAALATLTEAAVTDPGTGARLLRRAIAADGELDRTEPHDDAGTPFTGE